MRQLLHLAGRFFRSFAAARPGVDDQVFVASHIDGDIATTFWRQPVPDLDHALRGARFVADRAPGRPDLVRAFLLHDIGKRHARLGTLGRSLVTALALARLPVGRRGRAYLDHPEAGAAELESLGAAEIAVAFARHHHDDTPDGIDTAVWDVLMTADRR